MSDKANTYFINDMNDYKPNDRDFDKNFDNFIIDKISEISERIWNSVSASEDLEGDDIYSGNIGIAYMFWYLSQQNFLTDQMKETNVLRSRTLMSRSLNAMFDKRIQSSHSFLLGNSGICLIAGLVFNTSKEQKFRDHYLSLFVRFCTYYLTFDTTDQLSRDSFLEGRAGFMCAALNANHLLESHIIPVQTIENIGISSMKSGKYNALKANSSVPLLYGSTTGDHVDISISSGMSGTLLSLLCTPGLVLMHPQFQKDLEVSIDWILAKQSADGSYLSDPHTDSFDWFSGSSGICWLMAKAYQQWSEPKYKDSIVSCGELIWKTGLSRSGPGINGIAGNGLTLLMLYRATSDPKYTYRAKQMAKFLFSDTFLQCPSPARPYSLHCGWAGAVCFLIELLKPERARMPLFFDIFSGERPEMTEDLATLSETGDNCLNIETIEEKEIPFMA